jgi:hemolysin III
MANRSPTSQLTKPRLRGVLHHYSFYVSLAGGAVLVASAQTLHARLAAAIYALALAGLLGASALYHRVTWSPAARRWMRRLDHAMIFVLIAGTYTPFAMLVASGTRSFVVLVSVWGAALLGVVVKLLWIDGPKWVTVAISCLMGWLIVGMTPHLALQTGRVAAVLLITGGLLYTAGAFVYALRRPNPVPHVFGYHEVFHTLVVAAAAVHFATIALYVIPLG